MGKGQDSTDPKGSLSEIVLIDLLIISSLVLITLGLIYWAPSWLTPLRIGLGFVSVLFAPGYVTLAAVMPSLDTKGDLTPWRWVEHGLDQSEQVILSVIISIAIVPIVGIMVSFPSPGIRPVTMIPAISGYTIVVASVAAIRRLFFMSRATDVLFADIGS